MDIFQYTFDQLCLELGRRYGKGGFHAAALVRALYGSDVTMASTTAVEEIGEWVINGSKMFATNGNIAEYKVQRLYRDAKILEIYEGTKEVEKTIVARSILR